MGQLVGRSGSAAQAFAWSRDHGNRQAASSFALGVTVAIICVYGIAAIALVPVARVPGPEMPGIIPLFAAGIVITETATSYLLFVRFRNVRSWSLLLLGCAYLYSSLMALAQLLTFPGALWESEPLLPVSAQAAAWVFLAWIGVFSPAVLIAVVLEAWFGAHTLAPQSTRRTISAGVAGVVAATAIAVVLAVYFGDQVSSVTDGRFTPQWTPFVTRTAVLLLCASVCIILLVMRGRSNLFLWLSLALTAMIFHNVLAAAGGGRFTIGWTVGRLSWLISACVLFIYFLQEFSRQQGLLERARELVARVPDGPKSIETGQTDHAGEVEARLDMFVAAENIRRYKALLESDLDDVHRAAVAGLLGEEESRLRRHSVTTAGG
jgi:hypothetical protein